MKIIYKKKIYNGMAELRDYEVERLLINKDSVKIIIDNEYMVLTPTELKIKGRISNTQYSIYNEGQTYKLIGYRWKPTGRLEEQITIPFDVKTRLAEAWRAMNAK